MFYCFYPFLILNKNIDHCAFLIDRFSKVLICLWLDGQRTELTNQKLRFSAIRC